MSSWSSASAMLIVPKCITIRWNILVLVKTEFYDFLNIQKIGNNIPGITSSKHRPSECLWSKISGSFEFGPSSHWLGMHWGGTDLEREYGDVRPWRPPFHASPSVRKGPISSKSISSQGPLLRKFWNFSFYSLNFRPNLSSQAPKFGNF